MIGMIVVIGDTIIVRSGEITATYEGATLDNLQDAARLLSAWTNSK